MNSLIIQLQIPSSNEKQVDLLRIHLPPQCQSKHSLTTGLYVLKVWIEGEMEPQMLKVMVTN